jgi:hypothetical protein
MSWIGELLGFEVEVPELTERQEAQLQLMDEQINRAVAEGKELTPFVLSSMGLTRDDSGSLRNMTTDEFTASLDPIAQKEYENISRTFDQIEAAQTGEKSAFLQDEERRTLDLIRENRARQGGNIMGDELTSATGRTTADIQTLEAQQRVFGIRGDQERRDREIALQGVQANNLGIFRNQRGNEVLTRSAFPNRSQSVLSGLLSAQQPNQFQQGLDFKGNLFGADQRGTLTGAVSSGILKKIFGP